MSNNSISGYTLLSMPTNQVQPLSLLHLQKKGVANTLAVRVDKLFTGSEVPVPLPSEDYVVSAGIDKTVTVDIDVDSHLSLLEGLLNYLKISGSFKLHKNRSVKVNLIEARRKNVDEFDLDAYINSSSVNKASSMFSEMLERNELYVVTDVLKCKKYSLEYSNQRNMEAGAEVAAATLGEGGVKVQADKQASDRSVNEGDEYITIAVKAYRIYAVKDKKSGSLKFRLRKEDVIDTIYGEEDFPGEVLTEETVNVKS